MILDGLRFFALMSSVIAFREGYPSVPDTPDNETDLVKEVRSLSEELGVAERLFAFKAINQWVTSTETEWESMDCVWNWT